MMIRSASMDHLIYLNFTLLASHLILRIFLKDIVVYTSYI